MAQGVAEARERAMLDKKGGRRVAMVSSDIAVKTAWLYYVEGLTQEQITIAHCRPGSARCTTCHFLVFSFSLMSAFSVFACSMTRSSQLENSVEVISFHG